MDHPVIVAAREAGVVGQGGAGFPTHVKLGAAVDTVIANGCECEPLLFTDADIMERSSELLLEGLAAAMQATGASRGIIAIKRKHASLVKTGGMAGCSEVNLVQSEGEILVRRNPAIVGWAAIAILAVVLLMFLLEPIFLGLGLAADQAVPMKDSTSRAADMAAAREVQDLIAAGKVASRP